MEKEIWRPIAGYEGYEVSNQGRVRSHRHGANGLVLKQKYHHHQMLVNLWKRENGVRIQKTHRVHRLVADAWLSNPNNLPDVTHIDGNPRNNKLENLVKCDDVGTYQIIEKNHTGYNIGDQGHGATISNEKAIEIYDMAHFSGLKMKQVAEKCSVPLHTVRNVKHGYEWASVTGHIRGYAPLLHNKFLQTNFGAKEAILSSI